MISSTYVNLAITISIGFLGGFLGSKTKLPAGVMLGAALAVLTYKLFCNIDIKLPKNFNFVSQVLVGILVGVAFNGNTFARLIHLLPAMLFSCLSLIAVGFLTAFVLFKLGLLDFPTAYVATSPGSMNILVAVSGDLHADAALVASFHFLRILIVSASAPLIFKWALQH